MELLGYLIILLSVAYASFLFWCFIGWNKLKSYLSLETTSQTFVSVIIPCRNEEDHIENCLRDFIQQNYPKNLFEIIVADDHSTDLTTQAIEKFIHDFPEMNIRLIKMKEMDEKKMYKKQAITEAIKISKGELIITTDADCRKGVNWITSLASYYETYHPEMMSAPVVFENERSLLEKVQSLEFLGLIGIGASAIKNRKPFLCNGANLAFTRKVFDEVGGYQSVKNISSGDDTQLMLKIAELSNSTIHFVKSLDAKVSTTAKSTISELFHQRKRWASKITVQMNSFTILIATVAYLLHTGLLLCCFFIFSGKSIPFLIFAISLKIIPEFMLLKSVTKFFRKQNLLWLFLPAEIIYPVYIFTVGLSSIFGTYEWKGRRVN